MMTDHDRLHDIRFQLAGWILFVLCAGLFIAASLRNGDQLSLAASVVFLIACWIFMIPLVTALKRAGERRD